MTTILKAGALACCAFLVLGNVVPANEVTGTVRDVCGPVLPGTTVSVGNGSGAAARAAADGSGRYSLSGLAPGRWTITFELSGFQTLQQDVQLPENGDPVQLSVRLLPDLLMKQEHVVTQGDPSVRYRRYAVHGVVRARSGEPIPGATVHLRDVGSRKSREVSTPCTTDESGRYAVSVWSPTATRWQLSVEADGFRSYTPTAVELAPDEPRAIDPRLDKR
jgi:Carboxypeptidase regulatory-like domain